MPKENVATKRPGDPQVEYRLIDSSPGDKPWLDELRRRAYAEMFEATWGGWDEDRHLQHFSESMKRGHISLIEVGGTRVGMIQLLDRDGAVEIAEVQIDPNHQGGGIGTRVLQAVISNANERGLAVRLSVGLKNQKAIRLYERLGFQSVGQSETHYHMRHAAEG